MHVLLNALAITNRSGTGRYVWGLIHGFTKQQFHDFELSVLIPHDFVIPQTWWSHPSIRLYSIPIRSAGHRIFWEQFALSWLVKRLRPEILHSPAFVAPILKKTNARQIITVHDLAFHQFPQTIPRGRRLYYQWFIDRSLRMADRILTDSQTVANELDELGDYSQKTIPIHLAVDRDHFNPRPDYQDEEILKRYKIKPPYFLVVGTKEPRKNLPRLLNAYRLARDQGLQMPLVVAGRIGWMQDDRIFAQTGVYCTDYAPDAHLPTLYRNAHAFFAPSLYEGFDLPAIEALACGTPVVASSIPTHREVLRDHAIYVDVDDVDAWAMAMVERGNTAKKEVHWIPRDWKEVSSEVFRVYEKCRMK
ncbi:MAG: glycosyltransferase family 1 protein [Candidatus Omnitrophota bacterium]|jgi:glycosyltransferase involved in cell wall biosynthesis|nr:MAG: glycosyltransferase family 1 protein [Candidatus Omnitrophota bacterium]